MNKYEIINKMVRKESLYLFFMTIAIIFLGCSPRIRTTVIKTYDNNFNCDRIAIFGLKDTLPKTAEKIGNVRITRAGFPSDDIFERIVVLGMREAQKIGGNALRITDPNPNNYVTSELRLTADIYRIPSDSNNSDINDTNPFEDTASAIILHFYRPNQGSSGAELYPILVNDSVVFLTLNHSSSDVKLHKTGLLKITTYFKSPASYESLKTYINKVGNVKGRLTESSGSLTIKVEVGKEYYIKCRGVDGGSALSLILMREDLGKFEYDLIKYK